MRPEENDILQSHPELKKMPYSTPEGYFSSFKERVTAAMPPQQATRPTLRRRVFPYISMAAVFAMLMAAGAFFLERSSRADGFTQEDFMTFSDNMTSTILYGYEDQIADAEIIDEDIIEYLIYTGISAEAIESYR